MKTGSAGLGCPTREGNGVTLPCILGVIPARGGSKGIPKKNIRPLAGKPLFGYTIAAARGSRRLTDFLVSTDSEEIAAIARAEGAWVPFLRPAELATDQAPTTGVLRHALEFYERHRGPVHSVVTLQPTTPLRRAEDIDDAIAWYLHGQPEADSLISVCEAGHMNPVTLYCQIGERLEPLLSDSPQTVRRQEFERVLWRNGAIYITRRDLLLTRERIVGDRPLFYEMPRQRSLNIDDRLDLELAEWMLAREARQSAGRV